MPEEPQRGRAPSIRDVARLAGVSHQTVSRVLNNHPSIRPETKQVLRAAARAARLVDMELATALEPRLVADLAVLSSPSRGLDGAEIYRLALAEIGQPAPA